MQELQEKGVHQHAQEKHGKKQMIKLNEEMFRTNDWYFISENQFNKSVIFTLLLLQELQEKGVHHQAQEKHEKKHMINLNEEMFRTID